MVSGNLSCYYLFTETFSKTPGLAHPKKARVPLKTCLQDKRAELSTDDPTLRQTY
jgi:hypothetical protein